MEFTEWQVVIVIVTLLGLVASVVTPIVKLTSTIIKLNHSVDTLNDKLEETIARNSKSHDAMFNLSRTHTEQIAKHDVLIKDHEKRLTRLEPK